MKVLSLFSGVGGFDAGLENAGMETVFQCEYDKHCLSVLERHWQTVPKWGDVSTLTGKHILAHAPVIDVVAWGSPCQDLSQAGKKAGLKGKKSGLFHEGIRIIKELQEQTNGQYPRISIWENVTGALTSNRGADFGVILDEMAKAGALVIEWAVLDAQHWLPQRRRRVFLIAIFDSATANRCPNPILPFTESMRGDGTKDRNITFYSTQGRQDKYTYGICTTLKTVGSACVTSSDIPPRRLTAIESERLMGWDDDHTRWASNGKEIAVTHRYKMCGNGVASPVAEWVGKQIMGIV